MSLLKAHAGLAGKTAVILGGAAGVGRAVTLALADAGVSIATCDIDEGKTREIVSEVEALGGKILSLATDVADPAALHRFYDKVEAHLPSVDIVVNVPGGTQRKALMEATPEDDAAQIRLNYGYVIDSFRRAIPLIRKTGRGGSIISFTTIEAHRGAATYSVYAGAKAATNNFSRAMAVELAAEHIRVNLIAPDTSPSYKREQMMGGPDPAWVKKAFEVYVPQKHAPTLEDLANAVLFLSSDLSRAITGTTIHVDGGAMAASGFINWPFGDGFGPAPTGNTLRKLFGDI